MDLHLFMKNAVMAHIMMALLVTGKPAGDGAVVKVLTEDPCGSSIPTANLPPSRTAILHNLRSNSAYTQRLVNALYTQYCNQRSTLQYCTEAEEIRDHYLSEQEATSSGISTHIEKARKAYIDLSNIQLALTRSIEHEEKVDEYRSLMQDFLHIKSLVTSVRCLLKNYLDAHGSQVRLEGQLHMVNHIESTEGQVLADIYMLSHLNHILGQMHKDFSSQHSS